MQTVSCPSCGAPVEFKSHASVMAVCEYCRAAVLKDADSVKDMGKVSAVLEDYSPFQIGTAGAYGSRSFTVVGRIQLRYEQGMWNEWHVLFDDGTSGWLSDASSMYTLTSVHPTPDDAPSFEDISPGKVYSIGGRRFTAADRREAQCIGGQGELPFRVGDGWRVRAADLRSGSAFLTLDYTDGDTPLMYHGEGVTLDKLKLQLLRDDDAIKASAGRYRGRLDTLDCPSCGSGIRYVPGVTTTVVCPACAAQLDAANPKVQVLEAGQRAQSPKLSLELGAMATIQGQKYTLIGAMVRADEEGEEWNEYLLFSAKAGFQWLIESSDGWFQSTVQPEWPEWASLHATSATLQNTRYEKEYDYVSTVVHAAGAFNWRVAAGDKAHVYEFASGSNSLAAELTQDELTWSRSSPVSDSEVQAWFGKLTVPPQGLKQNGGGSLNSTQMKFVWWILGLNAIPLLIAFSDTFLLTVGALFALFYPAKFFQGDKD
jgi:hypothetical protein